MDLSNLFLKKIDNKIKLLNKIFFLTVNLLYYILYQLRYKIILYKMFKWILCLLKIKEYRIRLLF
jgi:hypothetical protein